MPEYSKHLPENSSWDNSSLGYLCPPGAAARGQEGCFMASEMVLKAHIFSNKILSMVP